MIYYSKSTYYNINPQLNEYINETQHWNASLYKHMPSCFVSQLSGLIIGLRPATERGRYKVTPSLIGWAQA